MSELSPKRWAYLKQLHPSPGRYLHTSCRIVRHPLAALAEQQNKVYLGPQYVATTGTTYNVGSNKAKRAKRKAAKEVRARVARANELLAQYRDKDTAFEKLNKHSKCWCDSYNIGAPGASCGDCPRDYEKAPSARQRGQCN